MAEADYQTKLKRALEAQGWTVIKLARLTVSGYPDLLAMMANRPPVFIEVKDDKGRLSRLQSYRIKELRGKGFTAIVSSPDDFADTVRTCQALAIPTP
jgi:hypothetical protein